jgi:hypothetical protein
VRVLNTTTILFKRVLHYSPHLEKEFIAELPKEKRGAYFDNLMKQLTTNESTDNYVRKDKYLQIPAEMESNIHFINDIYRLEDMYKCWREADVLGLDTESVTPLNTTDQSTG